MPLTRGRLIGNMLEVHRMAKKVRIVSEEPTAASDCCHYWLVEGGTNPTSKAVCKLCGVEREFDNTYTPNPAEVKSGGSEGQSEGRKRRREKPAEEDVLVRIDRLFQMVATI